MTTIAIHVPHPAFRHAAATSFHGDPPFDAAAYAAAMKSMNTQQGISQAGQAVMETAQQMGASVDLAKAASLLAMQQYIATAKISAAEAATAAAGSHITDWTTLNPIAATVVIDPAAGTVAAMPPGTPAMVNVTVAPTSFGAKLKSMGVTALGAAIGAMAGGPIGAGVGVAAGGLVDFLRARSAAAALPVVAPAGFPTK